MADERSETKQAPDEAPVQTPDETQSTQMSDAEVESGGEAAGEWHPPGHDDAAVELAKPKRRWYHWFVPRPSRKAQSRALQKHAASDVGELLQAVSHHLDRQSQVQERLLGALERLPEAIESMQKVGQSSEAQTQVLSEVKRQLESSAEGMSHFENSLSTFDATNRSAAETVASLIERSRETEEKLRQLVNRSERRVTLLLGVLGLAFIVVVGGALYYGLTGQPLPSPFGPRGPVYQEAPRAERLPPVPDTRAVERYEEEAPAVLPDEPPAVRPELVPEDVAPAEEVELEVPESPLLPAPEELEGADEADEADEAEEPEAQEAEEPEKAEAEVEAEEPEAQEAEEPEKAEEPEEAEGEEAETESMVGDVAEEARAVVATDLDHDLPSGSIIKRVIRDLRPAGDS